MAVIGIAHKYGDFIYRSYLTLGRDLWGLYLLLAVKYELNRCMRRNRGLHEMFVDVVRANKNKTAIIDIATGETLTFAELNALSNKFANYFQAQGYAKGDVVAIFMENSAVFVAAWMGLAKIGVITAWINTNLKNESLAHCISTSEAKAVIYSQSMAPAVINAHAGGYLKGLTITHFFYGTAKAYSAAIDLKEKLDCQPTTEPLYPKSLDFKSILCFIYTSGTTGLPKAAVMKHFRVYSMVMGCAKSFGIYKSDRVYVSLPFYHTSAGILGIGQVLFRGSSCAIRQKFSASNFWKDCVKYNCTASQYIGETCRYLLAQPETEEEKCHKVRLLWGNGLRPEIWQEFVDRFHVKIGEFYGSTEGTCNLVNIDGKVGSCGFLPISPLTAKLHPIRLLKVNEETGEVLRGAEGLCIPCRPGETGAMVSTIRKNNPMLVFEGYVNKSETSKKVIHNVFLQGDSAFLTGDILHMDRLGYVFFRDRVGDTYRWKGENVSTTEIEAVLTPIKLLKDVLVYGVPIPGVEGRAGMIAIVKQMEAEDKEVLQAITDRLTSQLASYAIPVFVRLCDVVDKTGTHKLVKTNLQRIAYSHVKGSNDKLFMWDPSTATYRPLNDGRIREIEEGRFSQRA